MAPNLSPAGTMVLPEQTRSFIFGDHPNRRHPCPLGSRSSARVSIRGSTPVRFPVNTRRAAPWFHLVVNKLRETERSIRCHKLASDQDFQWSGRCCVPGHAASPHAPTPARRLVDDECPEEPGRSACDVLLLSRSPRRVRPRESTPVRSRRDPAPDARPAYVEQVEAGSPGVLLRAAVKARAEQPAGQRAEAVGEPPAYPAAGPYVLKQQDVTIGVYDPADLREPGDRVGHGAEDAGGRDGVERAGGEREVFHVGLDERQRWATAAPGSHEHPASRGRHRPDARHRGRAGGCGRYRCPLQGFDRSPPSGPAGDGGGRRTSPSAPRRRRTPRRSDRNGERRLPLSQWLASLELNASRRSWYSAVVSLPRA